MKVAPLIILIAALASAQSPTGNARASGTCSVANTGTVTTVTLNCTGLSSDQQKLLIEIPGLLNKLLSTQAGSVSEIMSKLDSCVAGVNEVRERQAEWHVTPTQQTELRNLLSGHHADATVHVIPQDRNAALYGQDLVAALSDYTTAPPDRRMTTNFGLNPQISGVIVIVSRSDFPEAVLLIQSLRTALKLDVRVSLDSDGRFAKGDSIVVAVGAKP